MWSSATLTVRGNKGRLAESLRMSRLVGLQGGYEHVGPLPYYDHCGYETAIQIVLLSRQKGRNSNNYMQYDTIRKLRTAFSNQVRAAPQANRRTLAIGDTAGKYQRLGEDACGSFWYYRFNLGLKCRMGQLWKPNRALSLPLLLSLLEKVEERIKGAFNDKDSHRWVVFSTYVVVCYVISLRGVEGLLLDLTGLNRHWRSDQEHVIIALLGKVKGESADSAHLIPCVKITNSGINVKGILERLIKEKTSLGFLEGPAISDDTGKLFTMRDIDDMLLEVLTECYGEDRDMFPLDITTIESLDKFYHAFRTFRKTSDTRAINQGVKSIDVDIVNRWKTVESSRGKRPNRPMQQHYAQLDLLLGPFLRYTGAM